jgi:hypothetical protein
MDDEKEIIVNRLGIRLEDLFNDRQYMVFVMDNFYRIKLLMDQLPQTEEVEKAKMFLDLMLSDALEEYMLIEEQLRTIPSSEVLN